ncbi:Glycoprotein 3-alpha-L-fucosyltransferase A, partial [Schistosoma japonicum]
VNYSISYRLDSTIYSPYSSYQPYAKHDGPKTRYPSSIPEISLLGNQRKWRGLSVSVHRRVLECNMPMNSHSIYRNDILPIVMGASIEEYERVAPPYSFIHVDQFESPAKLAEYLKYLDKNDTAYNEYFAWHGHGIVHDLDSQPQCA